MKIDVIIEPESSPDEITELGALAESYDLRALWTPSHSSARDPFMALSELARTSSKIRLGTIALSPFEVHPLKIAHSLFTLNEFSNGRACIVVGVGGGALTAAGLKPKRRVRALQECVEILKRAATDDVLKYEGEIYRVNNYQPFPWTMPAAPIIYVGGSKDQLVRMSARVADGVMFSDITLALLDSRMRLIEEGLASKGRTKEDFRISNLIAWHVKDNKDEAIKEAREKMWVRGMVERWYISPFLNDKDCDLVESHMGSFIKAFTGKTHVIEGVPERILEALVDNLTLTGDPSGLDEIVDRIKKFRDGGVTELALRLYRDPATSIKMIGERVLPALD